MSGVQTITVSAGEADQRLDRWLRQRFPDLGHGALQRLLRTGQVRVDGRRVKAGARLAPGQVVRVPPMPAAAPPPATQRPKCAPAPIEAADAAALRDAVLHRDDFVIAIDKPAGLAVQGGTGQRRHLDAMLEALRFERAEAPRLVHRLDKDTSGVLLLARDAAAARALTGAFRDKTAHKIYWALVAGVPSPKRGYVDMALAKQPMRGGGERVSAAGADGKPALSVYAVAATAALGRGQPSVALLVLMPLTGRTHQLRAHCAALGTPIVGDGKYGGRQAFPEGLEARLGPAWGRRLMLHAREIALPHPDDGTTLRVAAPPPAHLAVALERRDRDPRLAERAADDLLNNAQGLAHS
ncbi:MAG: RluA family pseudouridine synthase, partial [Kiloniellaceae bacterium]